MSSAFSGRPTSGGSVLPAGSLITGPKGDTGAKGDTGVTGATGQQGLKGDTGLRGLTGLTGAKGDTGATGTQGAVGLTGQDGLGGDPKLTTRWSNLLVVTGRDALYAGEGDPPVGVTWNGEVWQSGELPLPVSVDIESVGLPLYVRVLGQMGFSPSNLLPVVRIGTVVSEISFLVEVAQPVRRLAQQALVLLPVVSPLPPGAAPILPGSLQEPITTLDIPAGGADSPNLLNLTEPEMQAAGISVLVTTEIITIAITPNIIGTDGFGIPNNATPGLPSGGVNNLDLPSIVDPNALVQVPAEVAKFLSQLPQGGIFFSGVMELVFYPPSWIKALPTAPSATSPVTLVPKAPGV